MQQTLHHAVTIDTADGVDLRSRDRLLICDDGQRFQSGPAEMRRRFETQKTLDQLGELWRGGQLDTPGESLQTQAARRESSDQFIETAFDD